MSITIRRTTRSGKKVLNEYLCIVEKPQNNNDDDDDDQSGDLQISLRLRRANVSQRLSSFEEQLMLAKSDSFVKELSDSELQEALEETNHIPGHDDDDDDKDNNVERRACSKQEVSAVQELTENMMLDHHQGSFDASTAALVLRKCPVTGNTKFVVNPKHLHHYVGEQETAGTTTHRTKSVHFSQELRDNHSETILEHQAAAVLSLLSNEDFVSKLKEFEFDDDDFDDSDKDLLEDSGRSDMDDEFAVEVAQLQDYEAELRAELDNINSDEISRIVMCRHQNRKESEGISPSPTTQQHGPSYSFSFAESPWKGMKTPQDIGVPTQHGLLDQSGQASEPDDFETPQGHPGDLPQSDEMEATDGEGGWLDVQPKRALFQEDTKEEPSVNVSLVDEEPPREQTLRALDLDPPRQKTDANKDSEPPPKKPPADDVPPSFLDRIAENIISVVEQVFFVDLPLRKAIQMASLEDDNAPLPSLPKLESSMLTTVVKSDILVGTENLESFWSRARILDGQPKMSGLASSSSSPSPSDLVANPPIDAKLFESYKPSRFDQIYLYYEKSTQQFRYRLTVVDRPGLLPTNRLAHVTAVVLISAGRESEYIFSSQRGLLSVAESADCARLVAVAFGRNHCFGDNEAVQKELEFVVQVISQQGTFLPPALYKRHSKNLSISFMALGGVGERNVLAEGETTLSGSYLVEQVAADDKVVRRLYFMNNPYVIQSEVALLQGQEDVVDKGYLAFEYHKHMAAGIMALSNPDADSLAGLVIGLGGGGLVNFLQHILPKQSELAVVELDASVVTVAENFFGFDSSKAVRVLVGDGLTVQPAEGAKEGAITLDGGSLDYLAIDVDSKDKTVGMSCPPQAFVERDYLKTLKMLLRNNGVLVINVSARDPAMFDVVLQNVQGVFESVLVSSSSDQEEEEQDLNKVVFAKSVRQDLLPKASLLERLQRIASQGEETQGTALGDLEEAINSFSIYGESQQQAPVKKNKKKGGNNKKKRGKKR